MPAATSRARSSATRAPTGSAAFRRGARRCAASHRAWGAPRHRRASGRGGRRSAPPCEREVREVLVVDRVELLPSTRRSRCGNSIVSTPPGASRIFAPPTKSFVPARGPHVVAAHQVGGPVALEHLARGVAAEEAHQAGDALLHGLRGHVGGRLDAEHAQPLLREPLEQVAVVARQLAMCDEGPSRSARSSPRCSDAHARASCPRRTRSRRKSSRKISFAPRSLRAARESSAHTRTRAAEERLHLPELFRPHVTLA